MRTFPFGLALVLAALLAGCQGQVSGKPPIHLQQNMDQQKRIDPQEPSDFWADGRGMRPRLAGTVAVGSLMEDDHLYRGKVDGSFAGALPSSIELDEALLSRGQDRFNIYCAPCHDRTGAGNGIVVQRGLNPPPNLHSDYHRSFPVGQFYDVITNGVRTMPSYAAQIPVRDRWAIAAYVRALQVSQETN